MESTHGTCDWCKQFASQLVKFEYLDGVSHHSCPQCHDFARLDVRQFNLAEQALRDKQSKLK
ncbi:hypothetical protein [Vibrio aphrogenes]|uniref:hypothetical protein n=1 Tax=Vibrio aphrogenes TaxID=1891186 RepID=UPI000B34B858|nr:hypothetical protein [Vibrio aphrogenes]